MTSAIKLSEKFELFSDHWTPKIVASANGQLVKLAKFKGEFVWHAHADEDELFFVTKGALVIHLRECGQQRQVRLAEGDLFVVPKGVEHMPAADSEAHVLMIEPVATTHTGDSRTGRTVAVADQEWI